MSYVQSIGPIQDVVGRLMPLMRVTADGSVPLLHNSTDPVASALRLHLSALGPSAAIIVLVHGFKYAPNVLGKDPHKALLALSPVPPALRRVVSWPRQLGFGLGNANEGLCIAFGWQARGRLRHVFEAAPEAGIALARLVQMIQDVCGRSVHIMAHSMGARVALSALPLVPRGSVGRLVMLSAAEFRSNAKVFINSPAGASAEFVNVTSRENDLFDVLLEWGIRRQNRDRTLGQGLPTPAPNWIDIQIDCAATLRALDDIGFRIAPAQQIVCHWSTYMRPGALEFYGTMMREAPNLSLAFQNAHLPRANAPRWSRIRACLQCTGALQTW
ncbi:MAG: alpha/beta hydrolase [Pseudomonadota bacterium]